MITEYSAVNLTEAKAAPKWDALPEGPAVDKAVAGMRARGFDVVLVEDAAGALDAVKSLIPDGAEVMNGSSTTLNEIGFGDLLKSGKHKWRNLHEAILAEKDPVRQGVLRRQSVAADYYVAGINAITQDGELIAADASGSRVGAFPFGAGHLVIVSGINKIVPSREDAFKRLDEYVFPLEDARAKRAYGAGSSINKIVILAREPAWNKGRTTIVLVKSRLGY